MKNIDEVLRQKETEIERLKKELQALHIVAARYTDGYRVARLLVAFGTTIRVLAVIAAVTMLVWRLWAYRPEFRVPTSIIVAGLGWTAVVAFGGFVVGVFVSAGGQLLRASLDCAVNSSPFFSNQQRAQIMSIPVEKPTPPDASPVLPADLKLIAGHKSNPPTGSPSATATEEIRCPKCGSANVARVGKGFSLFTPQGCRDCEYNWA